VKINFTHIIIFLHYYFTVGVFYLESDDAHTSTSASLSQEKGFKKLPWDFSDSCLGMRVYECVLRQVEKMSWM